MLPTLLRFLIPLVFLSSIATAKDVLIINSYHNTFSWTKNQVDSFTQTLSQSNPQENFDFYIEYMDTKRFKPAPQRKKEFLQYLRTKYKDANFALVYVTDDNALNFVRKYKEQFTDADTKVVFSGINNTSLSGTLSNTIYNGVFERTDPAANEKLALSLMPELKTIYLIGDDSVTDRVLRKIFKKELQNPQMEYIYLSDKNIQNILTTLKEAKPNSAAMLVMPAAFEDENAEFVPMKKAINDLGTAFKRPIFATAAVYMDNTNVIGGYCVSGNQQGRFAAHYGSLLLDPQKEKPDEMLAKTPNRYFFDMSIVRKFDLSLKKQNYPEAVFLHPKYNIYKEHTLEINLIVATMLLLLLFSILLARKNKTLKRTLEGVEILTRDSLSAVLIFDKNLRCIDANAVALEMFGCKKEQLLHADIFSFVAKSSLPKLRENIKKEKGSAYEITLKRYDGSEFYALVKGSNLILEDQALRISSIIDISERIKHEKALQDLNKELEQKVQSQIKDIRKKEEMLFEQSKVTAMGELISTIAHEWRQPLNSVSIAIQNLDEDYEEGLIDELFIQNFIKQNRQTIQSMSKTIDDFRSFFETKAQAEDFDIKDAVNEVYNMQKAKLQHHGITCTISGDSFIIKGYKSQFLQVLLNICNNAKDAIASEDVANGFIQVLLEKQSKQLRIIDNGGGIKSDVIQHIFEPYFTTKEHIKGVGMGLYLSKMMIESMDGTIEVFTKEGKSEFLISFA